MQNIARLLTVAEVSEQLGLSVSYLNKRRLFGGGPPFVKIGARVLYDPADIAEWVQSRKRTSTSQISADQAA